MSDVAKAENLMNRLDNREDRLKYSETIAKMYLSVTLEVQNYERAIELLEPVRRESTLTIDGYMMLGMSYKHTDQFEKAKQIYEEAILYVTKCGDLKDNWDDCNFYNELFHLHKKAGKWEEAIRYLNLRDKFTQNEFLKNCYARDYVGVYRELLAPYVKNGDVETVECMCKKAPQRCWPYLCFSIATACYNCVNQRSGRGEECTELIEKAIENYKRDISEGEGYYSSYGALADMYLRAGNEEAAENILQQAVDLCIKYQYAGHYWGDCNLFEKLGRLYYQRFQWQKALEYFGLWKEYGKYGSEVTELDYAHRAAAAYFQLGNFTEAYKLFLVLFDSTEDAGMHASLAMAAFGIEEYELAQKHYREFIKANEGMWRTCLIRIVHCEYMKSGQLAPKLYQQYEEEYHARQEKVPKDMEDFYSALAELAWAAGLWDKAEEYLEKVRAAIVENSDSKETDDEDQTDCLWYYMYKQEYEAAYENLIATGYHNEDGEAKAVWQWLKKKLKK